MGLSVPGRAQGFNVESHKGYSTRIAILSGRGVYGQQGVLVRWHGCSCSEFPHGPNALLGPTEAFHSELAILHLPDESETAAAELFDELGNR
mgnify:CR=1 FL=1